MDGVKIISEIREKIDQELLVPFIGAGLSLEAKTGDGRYPPSDKALLDSLVDSIGDDFRLKKGEIMMLPRSEQTKILREYFKENLGVEIRRKLAYKRITPSQHQRILGLLRFNLLMTTNYDTIIEDVIYPRPELFITHNKYNIEYALDEISEKINKRPVLVKLNGCQSQPESIALGSGISYYKEYWTKPLESIFKWKPDLSLLFIGYSFGDQDFIEYLKKFRARNGIRSTNYAIVTRKEYDTLVGKQSLSDLNLKLIPYNRVEVENNQGEYKGLWEILSQLKTERTIDLGPGTQTGVFFEKKDRASYLYYQEKIEGKSTCLRYLTPSPTNAISPEEYIRNYCPEGLQGIYQSMDSHFNDMDHTEDSWVQDVIEKMVSRKNTLEKMLQNGAEIRAICMETSLLADAKKNDAYLNMKYKFLLNMLDNEAYDLELRMIKKGALDKNAVSSFALMGTPNSSFTDLAIAYAAQANTGGFMLHVIERNTKFAKDHLVDFEKLWARSVPENKTRDYIRNLFKENL